MNTAISILLISVVIAQALVVIPLAIGVLTFLFRDRWSEPKGRA